MESNENGANGKVALALTKAYRDDILRELDGVRSNLTSQDCEIRKINTKLTELKVYATILIAVLQLVFGWWFKHSIDNLDKAINGKSTTSQTSLQAEHGPGYLLETRQAYSSYR